MANVEIEIDGKKCQATPGEMVIAVADREGITIPRFCYHKKLSIAANCRMCLVEVEKAPKTLPACATPITDGMKVWTKSEEAIKSQKAIMEFLLINHPLDCPICDQGGECELQDVAMGYGNAFSEYTQGKRSVNDEDLGPFIATDMTRCIHCTRCVRFGEEITGVKELNATYRGEHMRIGTYNGKGVKHELSGNAIDLCPVGALTAKPYRFTGRAWEMTQHATVSPHDCVGTNMYYHSRRNAVMRVVPRENEAINETWIADRDRFAYEGLNSKERLTQPMIKRGEDWETVTWSRAIEHVAGCLAEQARRDAQSIGALMSPLATVEEGYLFQRFLRGLGTNNIDHRLRAVDVTDQKHWPVAFGLPFGIDEVADCDAIFLLGAKVRAEQPMLGHRIRMAALKGSKITSVGFTKNAYAFPLVANEMVRPDEMLSALHNIVKALQGTSSDAAAKAIADSLQSSEKGVIFVGMSIFSHPDGAAIRALAQKIAKIAKVNVCFLTEGPNSAGLSMAGVLPHREAGGASFSEMGMSAHDMLEKPLSAYVLYGIDPDKDFADAQRAMRALKQAQFVVAIGSFDSDALREVADVILPITPVSETTGSYVNMALEWQQFRAAVMPKGDSRPGWKVIRALASLCDVPEFEFISTEDVLQSVFKQNASVDNQYVLPESMKTESTLKGGLLRVGEVPLYGSDPIIRRAKAAQKMLQTTAVSRVRIHPDTAKKYSLRDNQEVIVQQESGECVMTLVIDPHIPEGVAHVPAALATTRALGGMFGPIEIRERT